MWEAVPHSTAGHWEMTLHGSLISAHLPGEAPMALVANSPVEGDYYSEQP